MIGISLLILFGCFAYGASFPEPHLVPEPNLCPEHSTYSLCADSCAKTCRNPRPRKPCELNCIGPGDCICHPHHFKDHHGNCVRWHHCPRRDRRRHRNFNPDCEDEEGCDFEGGRRGRGRGGRNRRGKNRSGRKDRSNNSRRSTESRESRERCGPNEKYGKCKQTCHETCKSEKPDSCENKCRRNGCQCKDGFVKDKYDNCIPRGLCSSNANCGDNEQWSNETCVQLSTCQLPTCLDKLPSYCPLQCTNGGCVCKPSYVRDKTGKCVAPEDCNKSSGSKEKNDDDSKDKNKKSRDKNRGGSRNRGRGRDRDRSSNDCDSWSSEDCSDESRSWEDRRRCCNSGSWDSSSSSWDSDSWDSDSWDSDSWDSDSWDSDSWDSRDRSRGRDRNRGRDRDGDSKGDRDGNRDGSRDRDGNRDGNRGGNRGGNRDGNRGRGRNRGRDRGRDRSSYEDCDSWNSNDCSDESRSWEDRRRCCDSRKYYRYRPVDDCNGEWPCEGKK